MTDTAIVSAATGPGSAEDPRRSEIFVRSDVSDVETSSLLATHVLAQSSSLVRASLPEGRAIPMCLLLARAYGVEARLVVRAANQAEALSPDAVPIDALSTTPASAWELITDSAADSDDRLGIDRALSGRRLAIVQSIPIHYRVALFNAMAERLSAVGSSLHVLFTSPIPTDRAWISPGEMRFEHAFASSVDLGPRKGRRLLPLRLGKHLERIQADAVIAPGFSPLLSGRVARWCARRDVPFGLWSGEIASRPTAQSQFRRRQRRGLMDRVDFAVAYGWESARYLDSLDPGVPVVIGRNTTILPPERQRAASSPLELLAVSRAERGKALDLLVAAVLELRESAVRLTLVGDGPELPALQELAAGSDRVRFLGALPHDRVLEEYTKADVFLFPSSYDIFGLVLVEAMAGGLAVITSSAPGAISDLALDGSNCLVVTDPSAEAWGTAIRRVAEEPTFREQLGQAAAHTVRRRWTIEHAAQSMLAAFHLGLITRHEGVGA